MGATHSGIGGRGGLGDGGGYRHYGGFGGGNFFGSRGWAALISIAMSAGAFGGVATFLIQSLLARLGVERLAGITWEHEHDFSQENLYGRFFWGAVFGLVFLINLRFCYNFFGRALIYGLFPTLAIWLIVSPYYDHRNWFGWDHGGATPVFTLLYNTLCWAIPGYAWFVHVSRETIGEEAAQPLLVDP